MKMKIPEYIRDGFYKYKYILLICALGIVLVLISGMGQDAPEQEHGELPSFDIGALESAAEELFSQIAGVGKVKVKITLKKGFEALYADSTEQNCTETDGNYSLQSKREPVIINAGSREEPVYLGVSYPECMGAVIVCEGGDNAKIRLELTQAMKSLTGISADNIVVAKMKD